MEVFTLCNSDIDRISASIEGFLLNRRINKKVAIRIKLAAEEFLLKYQFALGDDAPVELVCQRKFKRLRVELHIEGERVDPFAQSEESEILNTLLANMGLAPSWSYKKGKNLLIFSISEKIEKSEAVITLGALGLGLVLGFAAKQLPNDLGRNIGETFFQPIFETFMGFMIAVAALMIFLDMVNGICSMGDMSTFTRIGKKTITRFMAELGVFTILGIGILIPFFRIGGSGGGGFDYHPLLELVLSIVPNNLLTPFTTGNTLQIVFIGICVGIAMLALSFKVNAVTDVVRQGNSVIQYLMEVLTRLLPAVEFLAIFTIVVTDELGMMTSVYKYPLLLLIGSIVIMIINIGRICLCFHISPVRLIKKLLPTYSICITTASSSAAFATTVMDSKRKLGINKQLANMGIPLGQVIYMPGTIVHYLCAALCMAEIYDVSITPPWLLILMVTVLIMSIAAPPVPGSAATCLTLIMTQMGIPLEAIMIVLAFDLLTDRIVTSTNILMLQTNLVMTAEKLSLLDSDKLTA